MNAHAGQLFLDENPQVRGIALFPEASGFTAVDMRAVDAMSYRDGALRIWTVGGQSPLTYHCDEIRGLQMLQTWADARWGEPEYLDEDVFDEDTTQ